MKTKSLILFALIGTISFASCEKETLTPDANAHELNTNPDDRRELIEPSFLDDEEPVIIKGHVKDIFGGGIGGANVELYPFQGLERLQSTQTDPMGAYQLPDSVELGSYDLKFSAVGYQPKTVSITVHEEVNRTDTLLAE